MYSLRLSRIGAIALGITTLWTGASFAQIAATATISSAPNGANFDYTVKLTDTGSTNIDTFWFAWTPPGQPAEYDLLPAAPSNIGEPTGWAGPSVSNSGPGISIEYYDPSGNNAITTGQTATFTFTSASSPTALQGVQFGFIPDTESFVYAGQPLSGTAGEVLPAFVVPEPSSALLGLGGTLLMAARRRRRQAV